MKNFDWDNLTQGERWMIAKAALHFSKKEVVSRCEWGELYNSERNTLRLYDWHAILDTGATSGSGILL